jgi:uncharacterized protein YdbL (DUF1318 family)
MTRFQGFRALVLAAALVGAAPLAHAIDDPLIDAAITAGQVGETAEGFLRVVDGQTVSQAVRDRLNQNEAGRRAAYLESARSNGVTLDVFARTTACTLIPKNTPTGAMYRDQAGQWRRNTGAPLALPEHCVK